MATVINRLDMNTNRYDQYAFNAAGSLVSQTFNVQLNQTPSFQHVVNVTSVRTPGFGNLKPWKLPVNPYNKTIVYGVSAPGLLNFTGWNGQVGSSSRTFYAMRTCLSGISPMFPRDTSLDAERPYQKAVTKLIELISAEKTQLGVSCAELNKTVAHVAKTATRIYRSISGLMRGDLRKCYDSLGLTVPEAKAKRYREKWVRASKADKAAGVRFTTLRRARGESRVVDLIADTWLEVTYGWKPMLRDVYSTAEALAEWLVSRQGVIRTERAGARNQRNVEKEVPLAGNPYINVKIIQVHTWKISLVVNFRIPNGGISWTDAFGLNNPLLIVWEKIPFSFVADWFIPIGTALEALTAYEGLEFHSGSMSEVSEVRRTRTCSSGSPWVSGGNTYVCNAVTLSDSTVQLDFDRSKIVTWPAYGLPRVKDPRSLSHGASAIALLQSLFLRK